MPSVDKPGISKKEIEMYGLIISAAGILKIDVYLVAV